MLSRTDPFIFLGPGCPTLYYPKPTPDQPALTHPLPGFIVAKSSIQPYAFIMPSVASTPAKASTTGNSAEGTGQAGRRSGTVGDEGGTTSYYEEGAQLQSSNSLFSSSQTEWMMSTKENFVFVETSQLNSQADDDLMGGDYVGGVASGRGDGTTASYCFPYLDDNKNNTRETTQTSFYPETFAVTESLKISTNTNGEYFLGFDETTSTTNDSAPLGSDIHGGVISHSVILYEEVGSRDVIDDSIQREIASMNQNIGCDDGLSIWEEGISEPIKIDLENVLELKGVDVVDSVNQSREVVGEILDMLLNDIHCLLQQSI